MAKPKIHGIPRESEQANAELLAKYLFGILTAEDANKTEVTTERPELRQALAMIRSTLADDLRSEVLHELQPMAQFMMEFIELRDVENGRCAHALGESAFRRIVFVAAKIAAEYGIDITKDKEAGDAVAATLIMHAGCIAHDLLQTATMGLIACAR